MQTLDTVPSRLPGTENSSFKWMRSVVVTFLFVFLMILVICHPGKKAGMAILEQKDHEGARFSLDL